MLHAQSVQFESVGYTDLEWCAPLPPGQPDGWFEALERKPPRTVVDLGCGTGAFLRAWSAGNRGWTVGIDRSERCVDVARARASGVGQWRVGDAAQWAASHGNSADLTVCIGVEDLGGDWQTMMGLVDHVSRRGKWVLIGVTVRDERQAWDFVPQLAERIPTQRRLLAEIGARGWRSVRLDVADGHAWQRYDRVWRQNIHGWMISNPDDPNIPGFRERLQRGRSLFSALGTGALSFTTVLARV